MAITPRLSSPASPLVVVPAAVPVYKPGQILTADELNSSFAAKTDNSDAAITGGTVQGLDFLGVSGTTASNDPGSGALVVVGGAGVGGNLNVGGKVTAVGVTSSGKASVTDNTNAISPSTGALVIVGGVGVGVDLWVGGEVHAGGKLFTGGAVAVADATQAGSPTTGALVVAGGAGIGKDLYVGGAAHLVGAASVSDLTQSTAPGNGAFVVAGGAGVGKDLFVGGSITAGGDLHIPGTIYGNLANGGGGAFFEYTWYSGTVAPPTDGQIQYDSATLATVSKVWISYVMAAPAAGIQPILGLIQTGSTLVIQDKADQTKYVTFKATSAPVMKTGYIEVPVTFLSSGGAISNLNRVFLAFNSAASSGGGSGGGGGFSTSITYYTVGTTDTVGSFAEGDKKLRTAGFSPPFVSVVKGGLTLTLGQHFSLDPDNVHINLTDALTKLDEVAVYFSAATSSPPALGVRFITEGSATAGQVNIGLPQPASTDIVDVYIGGAALSQTDFTIPDPGTTLVLAKPMALGTQYKVVGNPKYNGTIMQTLRTAYDAVSTAGQTTISVPGGFLSGLVDLYINGTLLSPGDYDDTHSPNLIVSTALVAGQQIRVVAYSSAAQVNPNMGAMRTLVEGAADAGTVSNIVVPGGMKPGFNDVTVGGITLLRSDYDDSDGQTVKLLKPMALGTAYAIRAWNPLTTAQPVGGQLAGFRNAIINGGFRVWQRGVNGTGTAFGADRWRRDMQGTCSVDSWAQQVFAPGQTVVPGNPKYWMQFQHTLTSSNTNDVTLWSQKIEGVQTFAGQTATASFWMYAAAPTTLKVSVSQFFGTGGSPSANVWGASQDVVLTTGFKKYVLNFAVPSIAGKQIGTAGDDNMSLNFWTNATASAAASYNLGGAFATGVQLNLAQVQFEAGNVATDFEQRPIGTELALCQRFFCKSYNQWDAPGTSTFIGAMFNSLSQGMGTYAKICDAYFPVTMRNNPIVTAYSASTGAQGKIYVSAISGDVAADIPGSSIGQRSAAIRLSNITLPAGGSDCWVHWTAQAEL